MENSEDPKVISPKPMHWSTKAKLEREAARKAAENNGPQPAATPTSDSAPDEMWQEKPELSERDQYDAEVSRIRQTRKPFGAFTQKLALASRPGYHRHWFNDIPGRIDEAKISGWTHVNDKGQPVKRIVGTGRDKGALYAFAMEIPSVFWEEDEQAKFARAKAPIDAIRSSPFQAQKGQAEKSDNEKFYSPRESALDIQKR